MKANWEDLAANGLGEPYGDNKFRGGVWIAIAFSSPVTRKHYIRGEFHAHPDVVLQKLANVGHKLVVDVRNKQAKSRSRAKYPPEQRW